MTATVASALTSVLTGAGPLAAAGKKNAPLRVTSTVLTLPGFNQEAINVASSFSPAGSLALLARPAASLLLDAQATQKPLILEGHDTQVVSKSSANTPAPSDSTAKTSTFTQATDAFTQASALSSAPASTASVSVSA